MATQKAIRRLKGLQELLQKDKSALAPTRLGYRAGLVIDQPTSEPQFASDRQVFTWSVEMRRKKFVRKNCAGAYINVSSGSEGSV